MHYFRRLVSLFLVFSLLLILPGVLILLQFSSKFMTAEQVSIQIENAHIYSFVEESLLPVAINEYFQTWEQPWGLKIAKKELVLAARRATPKEWTKQQVEKVVSQSIPYITGQTDEFSIQISLEKPVNETLGTLNKIGHHQSPNIYRHFFQHQIQYNLEEWIASKEKLTLQDPTYSEQFSSDLQLLFPLDWFELQLEQSLEEIGPYLFGLKDHFSLTVTLDANQALGTASLISGLLSNLNLRPMVIENVIDPEIERILTRLDVPTCEIHNPKAQAFCIQVDELTKALQDIITEEWLDSQLDVVYHEVAQYLVGRKDHFSLSISLKPFKPIIQELLVGPITKQPIGAAEEHLSGSQRIFLTIDRAFISLIVDSALPNEIEVNESFLRDILYPEEFELLEKYRDSLQRGWVYSDNDLRQTLAENPDGLRLLDIIRNLGASGWYFSQDDLARSSDSNVNNLMIIDSIDNVRKSVTFFAGLRLPAIVLLSIILFCIGILGAQGFPERIAWVSGGLLFAALSTYAVAAYIGSTIVQPYLHDALTSALPYAGYRSEIESVISTKLVLESERLVEEFASGVASQSLVLSLIASFTLVFALSWSRISKLRTGMRNTK